MSIKDDDDFDRNSVAEWRKRGVIIEGNSARRANPEKSIAAAHAKFWEMYDKLRIELKNAK